MKVNKMTNVTEKIASKLPLDKIWKWGKVNSDKVANLLLYIFDAMKILTYSGSKTIKQHDGQNIKSLQNASRWQHVAPGYILYGKGGQQNQTVERLTQILI